MGLPVIGGMIKTVDSIIDKFKTDDDERIREAAVQLEPVTTFLKTSLAEAQHRSWFVAGGRPAIIWVCAITLALYFWPKAIMSAVLWSMLVWETKTLSSYPEIGIGEVIGLVSSILGLGLMRTYEKGKGIDTKTIKRK